MKMFIRGLRRLQFWGEWGGGGCDRRRKEQKLTLVRVVQATERCCPRSQAHIGALRLDKSKSFLGPW